MKRDEWSAILQSDVVCNQVEGVIRKMILDDEENRVWLNDRYIMDIALEKITHDVVTDIDWKWITRAIMNNIKDYIKLYEHECGKLGKLRDRMDPETSERIKSLFQFVMEY